MFLVTGTWNRFLARAKKNVNTTVRYGWGSGDDPDTPDDEGYLGEAPRFAPDLLFLSGLVRPLGLVGNLSGKSYMSASYTDERFSPLELLYDIFGDRRDIASTATTIRLHRYRLHRMFEGSRDGGSELDAEFQLEAPRGVQIKTLVGRWLPGQPYETRFTREPWIFRGSVTITLK